MVIFITEMELYNEIRVEKLKNLHLKNKIGHYSIVIKTKHYLESVEKVLILNISKKQIVLWCIGMYFTVSQYIIYCR